MTEKHIGKVVQVTGPVLDIRYKEGELPALLNAIEIDINGHKLIAEVAQQIGDDVVRCIAMSSTDGLVRGTDAVDTGSPITVPVGDECLGDPPSGSVLRGADTGNRNPGDRNQGRRPDLPLCKGW